MIYFIPSFYFLVVINNEINKITKHIVTIIKGIVNHPLLD
jgi:hypothetical protein